MPHLNEKTKKILISIVSLLLLALLLNFTSNNKKQYKITGIFDKVDGLRIGDEVHLAGIVIGKVTKIKIDPNMSVSVQMEINKKYYIPDDSSASINTDGLLGDKYIKIEAGGSLDYLTDGGSIDYTQGSIDVEKLIVNQLSDIEIKKKDKTQTTEEK